MISKTIKNMQNSDFWQKQHFLMWEKDNNNNSNNNNNNNVEKSLRDTLTSSSINGFLWSNC